MRISMTLRGQHQVVSRNFDVYDRKNLVRNLSSGKIDSGVIAACELCSTREAQLNPETIGRVVKKWAESQKKEAKDISQ